MLNDVCLKSGVMLYFFFSWQVDIDTVWNEQHTAVASQIAAGCVTDLALKVAQRELKVCLCWVRNFKALMQLHRA